MKLDAVIEDRALCYMERHVNEGTKTYSPFAARSEAAAQYQPEGGSPFFDLKPVIAPADRVSVFDAGAPESLRNRFIRPEGILFAVHPETWASNDVKGLDELRAFPRGPAIRVAPSASTRTVFALDAAQGVPAH